MDKLDSFLNSELLNILTAGLSQPTVNTLYWIIVGPSSATLAQH